MGINFLPTSPSGLLIACCSMDIVLSNFNNPDWNEIPEKSKPNRDTSLYYLFRGQLAGSTNSKAGSTKSDNPYQFEFNLREDKYIKKQINNTALLSYLLYEDGKITIDEITPKDRFGILYKNDTHHTSASVGKSLVSYVTGNAICAL